MLWWALGVESFNTASKTNDVLYIGKLNIIIKKGYAASFPFCPQSSILKIKGLNTSVPKTIYGIKPKHLSTEVKVLHAVP